MCGIAGFVTDRPPADADRVLRRMTAAISHRGPDDEGFFDGGVAFLGHRRLSVVDLAGGHQPMSSDDGRYTIVFNGEVFNHATLRPRLERAGHRYRTRSDTETVLHSFAEDGVRAAAALAGMFAFAIWNRDERSLYCVRDRHGIKPFYYVWDGQTFVFGSEIKAISAYPGLSVGVNEAVLGEYLTAGYGSSDETLLVPVRKLPPGHVLELSWEGDRFHLTVSRYWHSPLLERAADGDQATWVSECRSRLETAVQTHLMADVPLGVFLSGGLDSSCIAALTARHSDGVVQTFSVGYDEAAYGELEWAAAVGAALGTDHHEIVIGFDQFFGALPRLTWHHDEPLCFPAGVPLYFVSALAARHVKVVLTGEGADELFAGYERYRYHLINERGARMLGAVPRPIAAMLRRALEATPSIALRRKLGHTFLARSSDVRSLYLENFSGGFSRAELGAIGRAAVLAADPYAHVMRHWSVEPQQSTLARMLYVDHQTYLIELLMKQDRMSMAASIESRVPFLDHSLVEFAMRLPDAMKLPSRGKHILKLATADLLPAEILHRPKVGFSTPLERWFRERRSDPILTYLCEPDGLLAEYLDVSKVRELIERHRAGKTNATERLWRLLALQVWGDSFITGRRGFWPGAEASHSAPGAPVPPRR